MGARFFARRPERVSRGRYATALRGAHTFVPEPVEGRGVAQVSIRPSPPPEARETRPVALLAPGPSLKATWRDELFDAHSLVVGINDVALLFRTHWLAFSDRHIWEALCARLYRWPETGILSNKAFCPQATKRGLQAIRPHTFNDTNDGKGTSYSMVSALWFCTTEAEKLGVHVEIHGYDASRWPTVGGINKSGSHAGARWRSEATFMRRWWRKSHVNHGQASAGLLAYLRGEAKDPVL